MHYNNVLGVCECLKEFLNTFLALFIICFHFFIIFERSEQLTGSVRNNMRVEQIQGNFMILTKTKANFLSGSARLRCSTLLFLKSTNVLEHFSYAGHPHLWSEK